MCAQKYNSNRKMGFPLCILSHLALYFSLHEGSIIVEQVGSIQSESHFDNVKHIMYYRVSKASCCGLQLVGIHP